jgi:sugar/nucleoside kinase (ribokinase family)
MSLLTIGTVAFDDIKTPHGHAERAIGGAATYIGFSAANFVKPIQLVSVIGNDFPESVLQQMKDRGINLDGLQVMKDQKSFFWAGEYSEDLNSRETLTTELNVLENFDPVLPENYKNTQYVMLGNLSPQVQSRVIDQLKAPKFVAMDTMNFWMDIAWDDLMEVIPRVDALVINDEEARQMSGEHALAVAAQKIMDLGPSYLVIKKGENGALLFHKDEQMFFAPALPLAQVVDPTGAGDTFAGGFMGYLARTDDISFENMKRAVIYGSAMASFCVEDFSIRKLEQITAEDLNQRVQQFIDLVHFDVPQKAIS